MPRARVYRGQQLTIGPIRILVSMVKDDKAEVHTILNNEVSLGSTFTCPVESFEKLLNWYEKLQIAMVNDAVSDPEDWRAGG